MHAVTRLGVGRRRRAPRSAAHAAPAVREGYAGAAKDSSSETSIGGNAVHSGSFSTGVTSR